jgi:hypothetical protein
MKIPPVSLFQREGVPLFGKEGPGEISNPCPDCFVTNNNWTPGAILGGMFGIAPPAVVQPEPML